MNVFFLDEDPLSHGLPVEELKQQGCKFFGTREACLVHCRSTCAGHAFVHVGDDPGYEAGVSLVAAGHKVYYYSQDDIESGAAARDVAQLAESDAEAVRGCELPRLQRTILFGVQNEDFTAATAHDSGCSMDALEALAILCQGYCAAHAIQDSAGEWGPSMIRSLLKETGWVALMSEPSGETWRTRLPVLEKDVEKPHWWRNAVRLSRESLTAALKKELGRDPDRYPVLDDLLQAIYPKAEENPVTLEIVAKAFRCIEALLRK
jgi:hypothetical protein